MSLKFSNAARFHDRRLAGRALARALVALRDRTDVIVLGLPRGGVPVAYEIAIALHLPFDVFAVRKIGVPGHEELAMGAVSADGSYVIFPEIADACDVDREQFNVILDRERREAERRERAYRDSRVRPSLEGKSIILVDDGLATGSSMYAAVVALREHHPRRIIVAVPVGAAETCEMLRAHVDQIVCLASPQPFHAVGLYYDHFEQTSDDEVRALLADAYARESRQWTAL
ncbi:MAG: phosphoribosyltransferase [Vulcanimicrobiaceae bacterium]